MADFSLDERITAVEQHRRVVDCIARGDVEAARAAAIVALGVFSDDVLRVLNGAAPQTAAD